MKKRSKTRRRAHGEGTIVQRADGRWAAALDGGWSDGKRKRMWVYGATQAEAVEKLTDARQRRQLGTPLVADKQPLMAFLERWLEDVVKPSTRPKTFEQYEYAVRKHLGPALGQIALRKLTTQSLQSFLRQKSDSGLSAKTVKHFRDVLRNALNIAVDWNLIAKNPAIKARPPQGERSEIRVFTPEQARCFVEKGQGSSAWRPLLRGARPGTSSR